MTCQQSFQEYKGKGKGEGEDKILPNDTTTAHPITDNTDGSTGPAVLVISGTSSGVGKTTVTVGLMAAFARRGYIVQPFKCGPDFLDGMHHEAAIRAGEQDWETNNHSGPRGREGQTREGKEEQDLDARQTTRKQAETRNNRRCVNLDGWMMGSTSALIQSFQRHSIGADICIIEGCMGLHDSANGTTDEASTAQIAKLLHAPVVLVIDGSMMARSVAAMALGYGMFDEAMRLGAVVVNKVGGPVHIQWIKDALELEGADRSSTIGRLKDVGTGLPVYFAGALPHDTSASIPERHLGLIMPSEASESCSDPESVPVDERNSERFMRLATLVEEKLDLDALLRIGQTACGTYPEYEDVNDGSISTPKLRVPTEQPVMRPSPRCRIGIAEDEAFCFYYRDNLHFLRLAGAELIPFSPLTSPHLPPALDGIYIGGGYPELHALKLEENRSLRRDIASFSQAGGPIFAECGGLMYLADKLMVSKDEPARHMCHVLPITIRMTPHMKMYYSEIEFTSNNPLFPTGGKCRGQKFHFSEVVEESSDNGTSSDSPLLVTPLLPGALPEYAGFAVNNTFASYFHMHFASYNDGLTANKISTQRKSFAEQFVQSAISNSPHRKAFAVSFVSAATEIIFALGSYAQSTLAGVTSVCDYPPEAQLAPRQIVCRSPIDAASMSSEEVDQAMKDLSLKRKEQSEANGEKRPPGHWQIDMGALQTMNPKIAFVQNTCDICDPCSDDVLYALSSIQLEECTSTINIIQIAPTSLEELFECIEKIAIALDVPERGAELIKSGLERLQRIETEVAKMNSPRPRVLSLEGLAPLCTGGHWLPDMKYAAGCVDALGDIGGCPARIITWEEILSSDPDILVISPCSASPTRTLNELHLLASTTEFWKLRSVQQGEVYIFDHGCFSRPGPRLIEGVEMMAALFRNIPPPAPVVSRYKKWSREALKYQCCTDDDGDEKSVSVSHCTTELSSRFSPCFVGDESSPNSGDSSLSLTDKRRGYNLARCRVTRCTIPGSELPLNRSAHCIVPIKRRGSKMCSLLLFGGETQHAKRLNDTWELHAPANGWSALSRVDDKDDSITEIGTTPTWEKLVCGKIAGEDVPTHRSNHAMVACGDHIIVFGGWSIDNMTPLSDCELLHIDTLCWTHCSTRGSTKPSPRGNPTLVYRTKTSSVVLFGGWNGLHALNDLWFLDMNAWQWQNISEKHSDISWPKPRTDHTAVLWEYTDEIEMMLVFGGNVEGVGPCAELWVLKLPATIAAHENVTQGSLAWYQLNSAGPSPPARTSHTAAIVGVGNASKMVIVGGTSSERGTGPGSMLCDAWVLHLAGGEKDEFPQPTWVKLDWSGNGLSRCRHSMAAVDDTTVTWWGGYDGEVTLDDGIGVWGGFLKHDGASSTSDVILVSEDASEQIEETSALLQDRWEAEVPVRIEDLQPETLARARSSRLPGAVYKAIHRHAVAHNRDTYIDPASGYSVFSSVYLKRRPCCGNGCRHCPYGHINVPGNQKQMCDKDLEW